MTLPKQTPLQPLSESEMNQLNAILYELVDEEKGATSMSMVDGLFTALAIAPQAIHTDEWLNWILAGANFANEQQASQVIGWLLRHYDVIQHRFHNNLMPDFSPIFLYREDGEVPWVADWCHGFMAAVHLRSDAWLSAFSSAQDRSPLDMIYGMTLLAPPDIEHPPAEDEQPADEVEEVALYMRRLAYRALEDYRHQFDPLAGWDVLLETCVLQLRDYLLHPAIDGACPCGSGRTFDECCGKTDRVVH